jgi:hypothetical protein
VIWDAAEARAPDGGASLLIEEVVAMLWLRSPVPGTQVPSMVLSVEDSAIALI